MRRLVLLSLVLTACSGGDDRPVGTRDGGTVDAAPPDAGASAEDIVLDPDTIDFGVVNFGGMVSQGVSVKNLSDVNVTLRDVVMGTPSDPSFSVPTPAPTIPAGGAIGITVVFRPAGIGARAAQLIVRTSAGDKTMMVEGVGEATPCRVNTSSLAFGNAVIGSTDELTFTVNNPNIVELPTRFAPRTDVDICAHPSTPPAPFCVYPFDRNIEADGIFVMRAQETAMFGARFTPAAEGVATGTINVGCFEEMSSDVVLPFDGIGVATGFVCTPDALDFGTVDTSTCARELTTCENVASEPVIVAGWAVIEAGGPAPSPDFSAPASVGATLAEGEGIELELLFCPQDSGTRSGRLVLQTDNPNPIVRTATVPLMGVGLAD